MTNENEIALINPINPVAVFGTAGGSQSVIDSIKEQVAKLDLDISTEKGRKEIASAAYKIARTKTALDDEGKKLKEDMQKTVNLVDAERKKIRDALDLLKDEVRKPLTDWEDAEKLRVSIREERIANIVRLAEFGVTDPSIVVLDDCLRELDILQNFDWQEFAARAEKAGMLCREKLESLIANRIKRDAELAELDRLRKEQELREQQEREARIAAEAAAKAKAEAEAKAAAEAAAAKEKAERERREAAQREMQERLAKEQAEARAKAAEEAAIAAAKQAEIDKAAAIAKAAEEERAKIEAEEKRRRAEEAARLADKEHRAKINREVLDEIVNLGLSEEQGKLLIVAIAKGEIPHIKIVY